MTKLPSELEGKARELAERAAGNPRTTEIWNTAMLDFARACYEAGQLTGAKQTLQYLKVAARQWGESPEGRVLRWMSETTRADLIVAHTYLSDPLQ